MLELASNSPFFIADKLIEPASNSIISAGNTTRVEPKAMQVLVLLASNVGQVVTREELEDTVWANVIVGPDALTNSIIKLRKALGDQPRNARFIETIPKTGYRLIAEVREAQAGDIEPPLQRRLSAILYADVAEYSRLTGEDEERTHRVLSSSLDLFSEFIRQHNGTVVHYAGDAILAEFTTVTAALGCAVEVQRELIEHDTASPDTPSVQFRIGINLGEVIVDRDDIYGDGVNIAARLEGLADTGGICISESVYSAIGNKLPLSYEFMGEQMVKNIAEPVRAYRVLLQPSSPNAKQVRKTQKSFLWSAAVVAVIVGATLISLKFFTIVPIPEKPTIAVLPFANVSVNVDEKYLAEGMTRDVINDLARVSGVSVIAYSSVETFDNRAIDMEEIRGELGAQYLVEGSIQRAGDHARVNVQFVDIASGNHLWTKRYDRNFNDFFGLQDEVVADIVTAVSIRLTASELAQIERLPTTNIQAYDYYLRAEQSGYIGGWRNLMNTIALYQKAIALDPEFADAHAGLARAAVEAWRGDISELISGAKARQMAFDSASRALEIDPANGQAYSVLAILQLVDGRHDPAITSARKAVELTPGRAAAHLDLGLVLAYAGESDKGVKAIETALKLNPKANPDTELYAGIVFFINREYERAEAALSRAKPDRNTTDPVGTFLPAAQAFLGHQKDATKSISSMLSRYPSVSVEYYRAISYFRRPKDLDHYLTGLKKAGLSQWAYDFQGVESDRLDAQKLHEIVEGKTWIGRHHVNGIEFFQQTDSSGAMAYRSRNSIQTGIVSIRDNLFCQQFDGSSLNRNLCGYVYFNREESTKSQYEYIVALPLSLRYFTVSE